MVTLETERTWEPGKSSRDAPPLDVASFLYHVSKVPLWLEPTLSGDGLHTTLQVLKYGYHIGASKGHVC